MAIRTLSGHLTATNKRHISAMFDVNRLDAKINRITYRVSEELFDCESCSDLLDELA